MVTRLIREAYEKGLTKRDLSHKHLTQLPPEIAKIKNLTTLNLSYNQLTQLPPEITELNNLTTLNLSYNQLTQLPPEITELKNLTTLNLSHNHLTQLPPEIAKIKNLTTLNLCYNQLTQLPPEITELNNLTTLNLSYNQLTQLPPEITELKNLTTLNFAYNQLTQLPPEIAKFKSLIALDLCHNKLIQLPPEIAKIKNLTTFSLSRNQLTELPKEIVELTNLKNFYLIENPLISPPPEIVSRGLEAIFTYLKESKTIENNEAKLILVGNGEVGKTCLVNRIITGKFVESTITEGIAISKWNVSAPDSGHSEIKLNIWDFGGQEIYHATHQFFLTKRSVYLLVWNARRIKDYEHIYHWLHTIEAFGEDSPIILVMSKMDVSDDDLNLKDLKSKFPQIVGYLKIDNPSGKGIDILKESIVDTAWNLSLMRVKWVDSWFKVRQKLENLGNNWINYNKFCEICKSEYLDNESIDLLDDYLNDLGVTLHFKDRLALKDIVILKPEWATGAFYKILSTKSVLDNEGVLLESELSQIWDTKTYPSSVYPQLMALMNKFELAYELPDQRSYLIAELLPKNAPDFTWDEKDNLCFYYCYDYFLPPGIITRFIVRMHQDIEIKKNDMPLCWRDGAVLQLQDSRALVKMKPDERQIEIRINGEINRKRAALEIICYHLDQMNNSIKKLNVRKEIPCKCSNNCPQRYTYDNLLKAEKNNVKTIQCHESYKSIPISSLLSGYLYGYEKAAKKSGKSEKNDNSFEYDVFICHSSMDEPVIAALIEDFKKENITYWVDAEQINFGHFVTQKIEEGLINSKYIVPCVSKNLSTSGWSRAEYSSILNAEFNGNSERTVIPLIIDNCEVDDIPLLLRDKRRATYSNKDEFSEFIEFLKK